MRDYLEAWNLLKEEDNKEICCICGEPIEGYGNNAEPVCTGICCDICNSEKVIPARLNMLDGSATITEDADSKGQTADEIFTDFGYKMIEGEDESNRPYVAYAKRSGYSYHRTVVIYKDNGEVKVDVIEKYPDRWGDIDDINFYQDTPSNKEQIAIDLKLQELGFNKGE